MKLEARLRYYIRSKYPESEALFTIDLLDGLEQELADLGRSVPKGRHYLLLSLAAAGVLAAVVCFATYVIR